MIFMEGAKGTGTLVQRGAVDVKKLEVDFHEIEKILKRHAEPIRDGTFSKKTLQFYRGNIGEPQKHVRQELEKWALGLSDAHVYRALRWAVESENGTWKYAKGILRTGSGTGCIQWMMCFVRKRRFGLRRMMGVHGLGLGPLDTHSWNSYRRETTTRIG